MSKPRVTTDEQDQALADWYWDLKQRGTVRSKARELGISVCAVYDAISRGLGKPTAGTRFKVGKVGKVSHETIHTESNGKDSAA